MAGFSTVVFEAEILPAAASAARPANRFHVHPAIPRPSRGHGYVGRNTLRPKHHNPPARSARQRAVHAVRQRGPEYWYEVRHSVAGCQSVMFWEATTAGLRGR